MRILGAIGSYRESQGGKALHASPYCLSNIGIVISSCLNEPPFPPDSYRDGEGKGVKAGERGKQRNMSFSHHCR